jgi:hypothetical protein
MSKTKSINHSNQIAIKYRDRSHSGGWLFWMTALHRAAAASNIVC